MSDANVSVRELESGIVVYRYGYFYSGSSTRVEFPNGSLAYFFTPNVGEDEAEIRFNNRVEELDSEWKNGLIRTPY